MRRTAPLIAFAAALLAASAAWGQAPPLLPPGFGGVDAGAPAADAQPTRTDDAGAPPASDDAATPAPATDAAVAPGTQATPAPDSGAPNSAISVAVIDAAPDGVDPAAAAFVTEALRIRVAELGFMVVPTADLYAAARRISLRFPVPPEGVVDLERELRVPIAITADVRAGGGYYQVILRARFANEPAERVRHVVASQWTLGDSIRAVVPALLADTPPTVNAMPGWPDGIAPALPDMSNVAPPAHRRPYRMHPQPLEISAGFEFAFGPGTDPFFNFLSYGRIALFLHDRVGLTLSVAYANLRGRSSRVSNVLTMVGVETAVDLVPRLRVYMPLRAEIGYLPGNGVVLRGTAGVAFQIARMVTVELDLLSPTLWILPESTPVSLNVGAQITYAFGGPARRTRRRRNNTSTSTGASTATGTSTPAVTAPASSAVPPTPGSASPLADD